MYPMAKIYNMYLFTDYKNYDEYLHLEFNIKRVSRLIKSTFLLIAICVTYPSFALHTSQMFLFGAVRCFSPVPFFYFFSPVTRQSGSTWAVRKKLKRTYLICVRILRGDHSLLKWLSSFCIGLLRCPCYISVVMNFILASFILPRVVRLWKALFEEGFHFKNATSLLISNPSLDNDNKVYHYIRAQRE